MSLVPYVIEQTSKGERSYDIYSRLLNDRIVFLNGEVNEASSSVIVAELLYLEAQDPDKDIQFYINSPGGSRGQCTDIQIQAEQILKIKNRLNQILAANTGKSVEEVERDCERDHFMTAEEAQTYGLIDKVIYKR